jgi:hypothetical protein
MPEFRNSLGHIHIYFYDLGCGCLVLDQFLMQPQVTLKTTQKYFRKRTSLIWQPSKQINNANANTKHLHPQTILINYYVNIGMI